jgi:hypothetical protein
MRMNFIAKVEDNRRAQITEIAGALEKLGVRVRQVQPILGLIAGSSEVLSLEQVKIEGIASVEVDRKWGAGMPNAQEAKPKSNQKRKE